MNILVLTLLVVLLVACMQVYYQCIHEWVHDVCVVDVDIFVVEVSLPFEVGTCMPSMHMPPTYRTWRTTARTTYIDIDIYPRCIAPSTTTLPRGEAGICAGPDPQHYLLCKWCVCVSKNRIMIEKQNRHANIVV